MSSRLIQSIFFLSICSSLQAMNTKQKDIVHAKLYEKYHITETPQITRPTVQPLPQLKLHRSKIRANHIKDLHSMNQHQQVLNSYERTKDYTPENLSILKPEMQKAYRSIQKSYTASQNIIEKNSRINALIGDKNAQILIVEQYINKLSNITDAPELIEIIKSQHCVQAYELLDFTTTLNDRNIPCPLTDSHDRQLVALRNKIDIINPSAAYIIQSIRSLQPFTEYKKKLCYDNLLSMVPETPETAIICQFLINYGDNNLSPQDAAKKFITAINNCGNDTTQIIQTISNCKDYRLSPRDIAEQLKRSVKNQKKTADIITAITETSLFSKVLQKLSNVTFDSNDPLIADFNYILAELHYYNKNYVQAHNFYKQNKVPFLKEKKVQYHAFTSYIATSQSFNKQDINYLSSLVGNVYNQLKKMDTTSPTLSYKVGLLIYALVNNNPGMNISEKTDMLHDALHHLECVQKNNVLHATEQQKAVATCIELHTALSTIYTNQNNHTAALKHTKYALQYRANNDITTQEHAIATILDNAEKNNPEFYKQHAQLIQHIVDFIITENHTTNITKNYTPPAEFVSSDLCTQLIPYCEQICHNSKYYNNEIIYLVALGHKHNGYYGIACKYIDKLSQPLSHSAQLVKAYLYRATNKTLSDSELESTFKAFVNNKKSTSTDEETILSLIMLSNEFFAQPEYHDLAIKLITKLSDKQPTPAAAIRLAFYITKTLNRTKNPTAQQWRQKLNACTKFYANIAASLKYDGDANLSAGSLLIQNKPISDYQKIISHFIAAIDSQELLPETVALAQRTVADLYYNWAITNNTEKSIEMLDKAMQYHNSSMVRYVKAVAILMHSNNQKDMNHALDLLEENITQNSSEKSNSQLRLAETYCHYSSNPARIPTIKKLIPLDIDKAINYLQDHNNDEQLLKPLISIFAGESILIDKDIAAKYTDLEKALQYLNILIHNNPNNIDYISHRMELHAKFGNSDAAITDIDFMLNAQNVSNTRGITKEKLLLEKVRLLCKTLDDTLYEQVIECFKQLKTYDEKNIQHFNTFSLIKERTEYLVKNNITTDSAIEWCCFSANACVAADSYVADSTEQLSKKPTQQEKDLAHYILSAAKGGNLNAQLIALAYLNAIGYVSTTNLTEGLRYSYQALLNPNSAKQKANTIFLIQLLQSYTKSGVALAYYILCDYYKEYPKEIEKMMLLFNQAKNHEHPENNAADLIKTICNSCADMLKVYVNRHVNNLNKQTLIDAIAVFTLGAMYQYNNAENMPAGTFYLNVAKKSLCDTFKLQQYYIPIHSFLGHAYYTSALKEENADNINYELLIKSAQLGHLRAVYKLAHIYIDQHKNGKQDIPIKTTDFMPLLASDLQDPRSRELFQTCQEILETQTQKQSIVYKTNPTDLNTLFPNQTKTANNNRKQTVQKAQTRAQIMTKSALATKLVKYTDNKENNNLYNKALHYIGNNKHKEAIPLLQQAAKNHPNAYMMLAIIYITDITAADYNKAEEALNQALSCGLIKNNKTKLFYNRSFLNTFFQLIEVLITEEHPEEKASHLLSTAHNTLINNNVDTKALCALFKEISSIDLSSIPEWSAKKKDDNSLPIISKARKNIVKDIHSTQTPPEITEALSAYHQDDKITAVKRMYQAAVTHNIPSAYIFLACSYLLGDGVEQNCTVSERYLREGFAHGLVDAATPQLAENIFVHGVITKQFCNDHFLGIVCSYIGQVITSSHESFIKQYFLQTIKKIIITDNSINENDFCTAVKDKADIDLLSIPEWTTEIKYDHSGPFMSEARKSLIKDINDTEIPLDLLKAMDAHYIGDKSTAIKLMTYAATIKNIPSAYMLLACNYLLGDGVEQNFITSEEYVKNAFHYGLTETQFCNNNFLYTTYTCVKAIVSSTIPSTDKRNSLQTIKKILTDHINMDNFYAVVKETTKIDLLSIPEWSNESSPARQAIWEKIVDALDAEDHSGPNANKLSIADLKKEMVKDHANSNLSNDFKNALAAVLQRDVTKSVILMEIAAGNGDPCACITLADNYLAGREGTKKSLFLALCSLKSALEHGLIGKQFRNNLFLTKLCKFLRNVISTSYTPDEIKFKQQFLLHIKAELLEHAIDEADFCDIVSSETTINLHTYPEWVEAEKNAKFTEEELASFLDESLQNKDFSITPIEAAVIKTIKSINQEDNFVKDKDYEETPDFIKAMEALEKGNLQRCFELVKNAANQQNPRACLTLASGYLTGKLRQKNNRISKQYLHQQTETCLKNALKYGVLQKQFCNYNFLDELCSCIDVLLTPTHKNVRQNLLSIIRRDFEAKDIDIKLFEAVFEKKHGIKLSTIPEWCV